MDNYKKSEFSNYGADITIVAPGERIESASHLDDDSVVIKSGTSLASPHVAGVMATFIGYEGISNDIAKVLRRVNDNVQAGLLGSDFAPNTVDRLVNTGLQNPGKDEKVPYVGAPDKGFPEDPNGQTGGATITATTTEHPVTTEAISADPFEGQEPGGGLAFPSNSITITLNVAERRAAARPTLS
jgi:subtilisin family serine protease